MINFKYNIDDKVEYKKFDWVSENLIVCIGYIAGYKYIVHPFEKEPDIRYAILDEHEYQKYLNYHMDYTDIPNYGIGWTKEDNILRKL